ncbi:MAG: ligand-binding sensor domain-containing protein [Acidobacteriaceae bacterium]
MFLKRSGKSFSCWTALRVAAFLILATAGLAAQSSPLYTKWINYTPASGFPRGEVYCVTVDGDRVWAGTKDGLVLLENGSVKKVFTTKDGLAGHAVMSVAVDKQTGDVWIATFGGLSQYSGGKFKNYTNLTSGLANDLVYGVAVQGKYVWVATTAGVNRLDTYTGTWSIFNESNAPFEEPWSYDIAVTADKIYFGVWGSGVLAYDPEHNSWKPYSDPDGEMELVLYRNQGLIHNVVSSVSYNPGTKTLWASTYFGLSSYDGRNWHNYLTKDSGIVSNFVNAVRSRGNEVWACTQKGLSELNTSTNTWTTYQPDAKTGRGKILVTHQDGKAERIESSTTLAHNYVLNIAFQGDDLWVATAQGLSHGMLQPHKE